MEVKVKVKVKVKMDTKMDTRVGFGIDGEADWAVRKGVSFAKVLYLDGRRGLRTSSHQATNKCVWLRSGCETDGSRGTSMQII